MSSLAMADRRSPRLLVIGASTSARSINRTLARTVAEAFRSSRRPGAVIDELDLREFETAIYSFDREQSYGPPQAAHALMNRLGSCDGLIISFAEHNWSYTAAWKNLFDWATRIERAVFQNKPALYLSASVGPGGASEVLSHAVKFAPKHGANLVGALSVANFNDAFSGVGAVFTDPSLNARLDALLAEFDTVLSSERT